MLRSHHLVRTFFALLTPAALASAGCADDAAPGGMVGSQPDPEVTTTEFVSAAGQPGEASVGDDGARFGSDGAAPELDASAEASDDRTVEEGDIYRVSERDGLVFNLNYYRGLQIIDVSDPAQPEVIGRAQVSGSPVEMYQVGDEVYALINGYRTYWGSREDVRPDTYEGGVVVAFDVKDPRRPRIVGRARVEGYIRTSRLTRGSSGQALYIAASNGGETYVASFELPGAGVIRKKSAIDLGGYVQDIQATTDFLMVARNDWRQDRDRSRVAVIDISDPRGTMVEGASVFVEGRVQNQFNLDIEGRVLRVVSGNSWGSSSNTNHIETFDYSDLRNPVRIDHETFGDNEDLYATVFLGNKAFFVTYRRVDPFHAFSITPDGDATEMSEFVVSGWNDFFFPVAGERRLIGTGVDDQNGRQLAISLYDITNLSNPSPLIARTTVDLDYSWSEANWDHRATSVLEDVTRVTAEDGTVERNMVLLPFGGWDRDHDDYISGVQIFTFSETTLTRRGTMSHGTPVRRSFLVDTPQLTAGNLSETELSLFDTRTPDAPVELGRVELAPYIRDFMVMGSHGLRIESDSSWYGWSNGAKDRLEVVDLAGDPEVDDPVATLEIPIGSFVYRAGTQVRVVSTDRQTGSTTVTVYDLSSPAQPVELGSITDARLRITWGYGGWGPYRGPMIDCFDCGYYWGWGGGEPNIISLDGALVFVEPHHENELIGTREVERIFPVHRFNQQCWDEDGPRSCTYLTGGISCSTVTYRDGRVSPEQCQGAIVRCVQDANGERNCTEVDPDSVATETRRYSHDERRHWHHDDARVLDLSDPTAPQVGRLIRMARQEQSVRVFGEGDALYLNYRRPHVVPGDPRPFVKYYFRRVDLSDPGTPRIGPDVNIPGELLQVDGDTLITRDALWGRRVVETSVNRLELRGDVAALQGLFRFRDALVSQVVLDGAGQVLVTHRDVGEGWPYVYGSGQDTQDLAILDVGSPGLRLRSELAIDTWAQLRDATAGRAFFQVPGGLLVINTSQPSQPYAQAFYPIRGWPTGFERDGDDVFVPAGAFGLYQFDGSTFNLIDFTR